MSVTEQSESAARIDAQAAIFHPGFGDRLRAAREALGMSLPDVAAKLKLSERQVEAMETEDFTQLPGEVFSRGFVRNYARLVKVDPGQLIIPVDIHAAVAETITAPSEGVSFASPGLRRWVLLPLLALSFFVLLVALLYYWLRQGEDALITQTLEDTAQPAILAPQPVAPVAPAPVVPAVGVPAPASPEIAPPAPASPTPATQAPAVPAAPVAAAPTGKSRTLRFAPALDAWIQVVDGAGKRYSKLVRAGSVELFAGEPPFRLVVGEAAQVQLTYDGHRIDLTPFIGQKVARLTLE